MTHDTHSSADATTELWDAVIIGGGAAGLSAAQMLGRSRRRTLVIDGGQPRNRFTDHMHGILGHDGRNPADLLADGRRELERYGVEVRSGTVTEVADREETVAITTDEGTAHARTLLLATGITDQLPEIPGLAERWGRSVIHCPYCHGWEVRDQRIGVLATAPPQVHLGFMVRQLAKHVTVFLQRDGLLEEAERARMIARGITVSDGAITEIRGPGDAITEVVTADGTTHAIDALFAGGAPIPHDDALANLGLDRTEVAGASVIAVDEMGKTSHPRIWAAGNVIQPMANVPMSASAGTWAGAHMNGFLVGEDVDRAVAARGTWHDQAPADFWEDRYGSAGPAWSGKVNATVADAVARFTPGRALDLGCGEGADVVHLAQLGWEATGVDISPTAITRAAVASVEAGAESATFVAADLSEWEPDGTYDLVTASFLHSPVHLPRTAILQRASAAVAPGGHVLLVTHAAAPPWADPEHVRHHSFLTAREEADALALDPEVWEEVRVEEVERDAVGPDGKPGHLVDGVVLLRRR